MADEKTPSNIFVLTQPAEIAFCNLFEKRAVKGSQREQWDMTVLLPLDSPDFEALKKLTVSIFRAKAPHIDMKDRRNWQPPFESGDSYIQPMKAMKGDKAPDNEFMRGKVLFKSHSMLYAPRLSVVVGNDVKDFRDDARMTVKDKFYSGCLVLAEFNLQYHGVGTNTPGVTAYLNAVCSLNKGERRGGGKTGSETFGAYLGHIVSTDPTAGMLDDEIPF